MREYLSQAKLLATHRAQPSCSDSYVSNQVLMDYRSANQRWKLLDRRIKVDEASPHAEYQMILV